jgi:hypothetical protein
MYRPSMVSFICITNYVAYMETEVVRTGKLDASEAEQVAEIFDRLRRAQQAYDEVMRNE